MRDGRGALGICLAKVTGEGEDMDKLLHRLKRTQKEGPCPSDIPFWLIKPAVDVNGNSQNEELSLEMRNDLSEFNLLLHNGNQVLPSLNESLRRNSAAAQSKTVDLFFAPVEEECFAGVSCGVGEALVRDWLGGGPRATDGHRGWCHKGEPWESGLLCRQKPSEMGISEDQPPSAFLEGLGPELEPSCLHSILSTLLHTRPEVFLNDETTCFPWPFRAYVFRANSRIQENTFKCKKYLKWSADNTGFTGSTSFRISKAIMP